MSSDKLSKQIDYKVTEHYTPKYRFLRLAMVNQTNASVTIGNGTTQLLQWMMPRGNTVYNLARSYISYDLEYGAAPNPGFNWSFEDTFDLSGNSNVQFGPAGGNDILMNLNYSSNFVKINRKVRTPLDEFLTNDIRDGLYPCNNPKAITSFPAGLAVPDENIYGLNQYTAAVNVTDTQYAFVSAAEGGENESEMTRYRHFPLSAFKDTILGVDKDLVFPNIDMYLSIYAGPATKMGFCSTDTANPSTGQQTLENAITISGIYLYLACESNQVIIDSLMHKYQSGTLKFQFPYTTGFRNPSVGSSANIQLQFTRQWGRKLLKITHTVWNNTETGNTAYDCQNVDGGKIENYTTFINNKQLTDAPIYCFMPGNGDLPADNPGLNDWRENQRYLKGSVIQNAAMYQMNWCHIDAFGDINNFDGDDLENLDQGLTLDGNNTTWQINATTAGDNLNHYTYVTFSRMVHVHNSTMELVS